MIISIISRIKLWFNYPIDDSFWYHVRIGRVVANYGNRDVWDCLSYAPEGRKSDTYPPLIHYVLGGLFFALKKLKIGAKDYETASFIGIVSYIAFGFSIHWLFKGSDYSLLITLFVLSTPIIFLRINKYCLRGEILVVPLIPFVIYFLSKQSGTVTGLLLFVFLSICLFSSKTSIVFIEFAFFEIILYSLIYKIGYLWNLVPITASYIIAMVYYRTNNTGFEIFSILNYKMFKGSFIERKRLPRIKTNIIISEEEMPPTLLQGFYLLPSIVTAFCALFIAVNSPEMFLWKVMFVYYFLCLSLGKRYLLYLAFPATVLSMSLLKNNPTALILTVLCNIIFLLRLKRLDMGDLYNALRWIKEKTGSDDMMVITWWNHGHMVSGYGCFKNLWDSYYPDVDKFLLKEKVFDEILRRGKKGRVFCSENNVQYIVLDSVKCKHVAAEYKLCRNGSRFKVYSVS